MRFWRCFWMGTKPPGTTEQYVGQPRNGPHPWPIRDHGWLADEVLAGTSNAAGQTWSQARAGLYDDVAIGEGTPGLPRAQEAHVGMQFRMGASGQHNQLAALVNGITHVRPLGWEEYVDGFKEEDLGSALGWDMSTSVEQGWLAAFALQPFGAAHVYGLATGIDAKLDALGITRRTAGCPELQAMATIACVEYTLNATDGFVRTPFTRPTDWLSLGDDIEWCSHQDIWAALNSKGWEWRASCLVQPVKLVEYIPSAGIETKTDTSASNSNIFPWFHSRPRALRTILVAVPDEGGTPAYQFRPLSKNRITIAAERSMPAQVLSRRATVSSPWPADFKADILRIGQTTGAIWDAFHRMEGTFEAGPGGPYILWSARLLAPSAFTDDWDVVCVPWRRLVHAYTADDVGPRVFLDFVGHIGDWPVSLPPAVPIAWLRVPTGGIIKIDDLVDDDRHTWDLIVRPRNLKAL